MPSKEARERTAGSQNPRIACWLSVVPGLGQLYNGYPGRAAIALLGTLACFALSLVAVEGPNTVLPAIGAGGLLTVIAGIVGVLLFLTFFLAGMTFWYIAFHDALTTARDLRAGRASKGRWWFFHR